MTDRAVGTIRLVTWNVLGAEARANQQRALAERLHALAPDILCLQEARRPLVRRLRRRVPELARSTFVSKRREWRLPPWQEGLAILSRSPWIGQGWGDLDGGRRVEVSIASDVAGTIVRVVNVHLDTETSTRARNVECVASTIAVARDARHELVVVVGDLNTKPRAPDHPDRAYRRLLQMGLVDAVALTVPEAADPTVCPSDVRADPGAKHAARCAYTSWHDARSPDGRSGSPHQRLDYVLVPDDPRIIVERAWSPVPTDDDFDAYRVVSDHLPVIADLRVGRGG